MPGMLISILRTAVPAWWGGVVAWLLAHDLITADMATAMDGWSVAMVTALGVVATVVWYAVVRWAEPRLSGWLRRILPAGLADLASTWLRRLLIGSATPPTYLTRTPARRPGTNPYGSS